MIADDLLGQESARALLSRLAETGRVPHALLFQGPEGTGKRAVAERFAAALLCAASPGASCGRCASCLKARHGAHPDLLRVERLPKVERKGVPGESAEEDEDESGGAADDLRPFIVIDQIRWLNEHAAFPPREGRRRVFIVDPADRMNLAAQNALLKTLEEPPATSILILVASRPHVLLPTVRSRCFAVRFGPMPADELARGLEARGLPKDEALARAALAGGRPGRAIGLHLDDLRRHRGEILDALVALVGGPAALADLPAMVETVAGESEDDLAAGLDLAEALLRDAARAATGAGGLVHADLEDRLARLGARLGAARASALVEGIERARGLLRIHANRTLIAESILCAAAGGADPR